MYIPAAIRTQSFMDPISAIIILGTLPVFCCDCRTSSGGSDCTLYRVCSPYVPLLPSQRARAYSSIHCDLRTQRVSRVFPSISRTNQEECYRVITVEDVSIL